MLTRSTGLGNEFNSRQEAVIISVAGLCMKRDPDSVNYFMLVPVYLSP
jgi:hypothetical protein